MRKYPSDIHHLKIRFHTVSYGNFTVFKNGPKRVLFDCNTDFNRVNTINKVRITLGHQVYAINTHKWYINGVCNDLCYYISFMMIDFNSYKLIFWLWPEVSDGDDSRKRLSRDNNLTFSWVVNVSFLEKASGNSNSKISSKCVNDHRTTNIGNAEDSKENICIELKDPFIFWSQA